MEVKGVEGPRIGWPCVIPPSRRGRRNPASAQGLAVRAWRPGEVAIVACFVSAPFGALGLVSLIALFGATLIACGRNPRRAFEPIPLLCFALLILLTVGLSNPNVVSLSYGMLGLRLSTVFVLSLILGYMWPSERRPPFAVIWWSTLVLSFLSIVVFLFFPSLEASVGRAHDIYTATFRGQARLQGLWPAPAHASLAAVFLVLVSLRKNRFLSWRYARIAGASVGLTALFLTQIRVGIVALIVGVAVIVLVTGGLAATIRAAYACLCTAALVALLLADQVQAGIENYPALASLADADSDSRFLNRIDTWDRATQMIAAKPLTGWGPGSAGSTLGAGFPPDGHVTPHSLYLKYGVEAGLPAVAAIVLVMVMSVVLVLRTRDETGFGLPVLIPMLVTSITGTVVEAIPVSVGFGALLGAAFVMSASINRSPRPADQLRMAQ